MKKPFLFECRATFTTIEEKHVNEVITADQLEEEIAQGVTLLTHHSPART